MQPRRMRLDIRFLRRRQDSKSRAQEQPCRCSYLRPMKQENARMSAARTNSSRWMAPEIAHVIYQRALAVGILFGVGSLILAVLPQTREQFFHSYLIGFFFWLGIALGSMAFLMIQHLTGGAWGMVIRRPLEAAVKTLPLLLALAVPLFFGTKYLYIWASNPNADAHIKDITRQYLKVGGTAHFLFLDGYVGRTILYFIIWILISRTLIRWSDEQDRPPVQNLSPRFRKLAAPGLILYAFTI